jgi:hypothetical protein
MRMRQGLASQGGGVTEQAMTATGITTADVAQLWSLKLHYDGQYHISLTDGIWLAIRDTDPLVALRAPSGGQLADKIKADLET